MKYCIEILLITLGILLVVFVWIIRMINKANQASDKTRQAKIADSLFEYKTKASTNEMESPKYRGRL